MALPRNTTKDVQDNPLSFLAAAMLGGSKGAIRGQESAGQQDFIHSESLPSEMRSRCREILESLGAKFGNPDPSDSLFVPCTLPSGWIRRATDHPMWSDLLDEKGRKRGVIFYKAAFYDRKAWMTLIPRFSYSQEYDVKDGVSLYVTDCDQKIHDIEKVMYETDPAVEKWRSHSDAGDTARKAVDAWFAANYPDWQNPAAYWD